jgi:hypothetical protein
MSEQSNISGEQETNLNSGLQEITLNLENEKTSESLCDRK